MIFHTPKEGEKHFSPEIITLMAASAVIVLILSFFISRYLTGTNGKLANSVENFIKGRSNTEGQNGKGGGNDDILKNFNSVANNILNCSDQIESISKKLLTATEELTENINRTRESAENEVLSIIDVSASVEVIAAGIDDVGKKSETQSSELKILVNLLKGLTDTAEGLGKKIDQFVSTAKVVADEAIEGQKDLNNATEEMLKIIKRSQSINEVLSVINDVSDQINLLSLNAAIEAARAGESGRGFAVVADEISKLADKTSSSVKDITDMLKEISGGLESNTRSIQEAVVSTGEIMGKIQEFHSEIKKVARSVQDQAKLNSIITSEASTINDLSEDIDNATTEQKLAIYNVLTNVNEINTLFKDTLMGIKELKKTTDQASKTSFELKKIKSPFMKD